MTGARDSGRQRQICRLSPAIAGLPFIWLRDHGSVGGAVA